MVEKPSDCTCPYPEIVARNITGHAVDCPSYKRLIAQAEKPDMVAESRKQAKQDVKPGFHAQEGWMFRRLPNGSVEIEATYHHIAVTVSADTWASIVASVSRYGETAQSFQMAQAFHNLH